jgi:hypothetical protein
MIDNLYSIIINNPIIIETLFNLETYELTTINPNKRIIIKKSTFDNIYKYIPILKDFFNEIFINDNEFSYIITETFEIDYIKYEIKLHKNNIFDNYDYLYKFSFLIYLSFDTNNKNKINIHLENNKINTYDKNLINQTIIYIITNYLENEQMEFIKINTINNKLKPIFSSLNPHSFELNII